METTRIPLATYRLQFNRFFTFQDAAHLIPYLSDLGITDCYASPYLKAVPNSSHGYDIVDPTTLNPELGTEADYQDFIHALQNHGMGHILDIVPNHLGIADACNPWWQDVLENGICSRYASLFDIDWHPVKPELENKVLLPVLGDHYGIVLENQEITLCYENGRFFLRYYQQSFPLDPNTWLLILTYQLKEFLQQQDPGDPDILQFNQILSDLGNLPTRHDRSEQQVTQRYREKERIKQSLAEISQRHSGIEAFIEKNCTVFNGQKGNPRSFDLLDALLLDQAYRLASWRVASEEINYRRFFDVNQLAAIRMEEPWVFHEVHGLVCQLIQRGCITGLRVDHVDGLYAPGTYLSRWQQWIHQNLNRAPDNRGRAFFMVVEKILGKGERLSDDWPIHGTTGYEFLALSDHLFIDASQKKAFDSLYTQFIKSTSSFEELLYDCKKLIMNSSMSSELNTLAHQLDALSEQHRRSRDFTLNNLTHALREIIACFPVYRTYISPDLEAVISDVERAYIRLAVTKAKRNNPTTSSLVFDFIQDLLLKTLPAEGELSWQEVYPFIMKFQQTTSPVTAKGVEDTAFYRYNRLISLNEVGGEPDHFGIPVPTFHERMRERQQTWPHSLSTTSTHDTKRSEDVRARLAVLSELPREWKTALRRWHRLNKKYQQRVEDQRIPSRNEEYLFYQTLLGVWPLDTTPDTLEESFGRRIQEFMLKALREAKVHTSWISPNEPYEQAVHTFINTVLDTSRPNLFLAEFLPFQQKIAAYGRYNSLAQLAIKITAPGIPDFYQGTELWDFHLVDPDNRHPVDFTHRTKVLRELLSNWEQDPLTTAQDCLTQWTDGRLKLLITTTLLRFRRKHPTLFLNGDYLPLDAFGEKSDHICAFARRSAEGTVLSIVPRLLTSVVSDPWQPPLGEPVWSQTMIQLPHDQPGQVYRNIMTGVLLHSTTRDGQTWLPVSEIFHHLPVAVLESIS